MLRYGDVLYTLIHTTYRSYYGQDDLFLASLVRPETARFTGNAEKLWLFWTQPHSPEIICVIFLHPTGDQDNTMNVPFSLNHTNCDCISVKSRMTVPVVSAAGGSAGGRKQAGRLLYILDKYRLLYATGIRRFLHLFEAPERCCELHLDCIFRLKRSCLLLLPQRLRSIRCMCPKHTLMRNLFQINFRPFV